MLHNNILNPSSGFVLINVVLFNLTIIATIDGNAFNLSCLPNVHWVVKLSALDEGCLIDEPVVAFRTKDMECVAHVLVA
jgi:hypothetical protein